jgi:6-phosphogluconolactonase
MRTQWRILLLFLPGLIGSLVLSGCSSCPSSLSGNGTGTGASGAGAVTGSSTCGATPGGGGTEGGATTTALLYYFGPGNIQGASLNSSGTFANLSPFAPPTVSSSSINSMVIVNQQFLYVPVAGLSQVQGFSINQTGGALTAISGSPFVAQASDDTVTTDPGGRFLFVGGRYSSSISVYQIGTTGMLTLVPGSPFQSFNVVFANSLTVDSTGTFLYVGQTFSSNPIAVFSINQSTGALTEIAGSPFPLGVAVVQADPSGNFLLGVADGTGTSGDQHIYVFSIDPTTGTPTLVPSSPFATVNTPFALTIHPSGAFVYPSVADGGGTVTSLEGYQLDATSGALTALPESPFTTLPAVANCQFEQTGTFAFCPDADGFAVLGANTSTGALSNTVPDLVTSSNFPFAATD